MKTKRVLAAAIISAMVLSGPGSAVAVDGGPVEDTIDQVLRTLHELLGLTPSEARELLGLDPRGLLPQPTPDDDAQTTSPPQPGPDPDSASALGRHAEDAYASARATGEIPEGTLDVSQAHFDAAMAEWRGADPTGVSPRQVQTSLAAASGALDAAGAPGGAVDIQLLLAEIGLSINERIVAAYGRTDVDPRVKAEQEAALEAEKARMNAGLYTQSLLDGLSIYDGAPQLIFDMDQFEQNILNAFTPNAVGFSYSIARNGLHDRSDGVGQARTQNDSPFWQQSEFKEMNIASISKTMTAVAVFGLMDQNNLTLDSPISPWLPSWWQPGPGVNALTFRHLMTHTSGLNNNDGTQPYAYANLVNAFAAGVNASQSFAYQNLNYSFFRVMIPRMAGLVSDADTQGAPVGTRNQVDNNATINAYEQYMQDTLFSPLGITAACAPVDFNPTLFYNPGINGPGQAAGNWRALCGSGGWYMSAREIANFMANMRYNDAILSPANRLTMNLNFAGWMDPEDYNHGDGDWGVYRNHGGDLFWNLNIPLAQRLGMDSCVMDFPNGTQATVLINSQGPNYPALPNSGYQCAVLQVAYDNAWVAP